ncbi:MAG TPA: hypothetical protein VHL11_02825, partial [Phototrophicaceae bacterium]|nr:hypothetical protein [Phototrophicaceae bacterium]
ARAFQQLFDFSRYQLIFAHIWKHIIILGGWQVSLFLMLAAFLLLTWKSLSPGRLRWIPFSLLFFQFVSYFIIFLITPHDLYWHLQTALSRLMFHIFPLFLFWLFILLPSPENIFVSKTAVKIEI